MHELLGFGWEFIQSDTAAGALAVLAAVVVMQGFAVLRDRRKRRYALEDAEREEERARQSQLETAAERDREQREAKPKALRGALNLAVAAERSWVAPTGHYGQYPGQEEYDEAEEARERYDQDFLDPLYNAVRNLRKHGFVPSMGARRHPTPEQLKQLVVELEEIAPPE